MTKASGGTRKKYPQKTAPGKKGATEKGYNTKMVMFFVNLFLHGTEILLYLSRIMVGFQFQGRYCFFDRRQGRTGSI